MMTKLIFETIHDDNDIISELAYSTGRMIEKVINERNDNIIDRMKELEAKVLTFYNTLDGRTKLEYKKHFNIISYFHENK